MPAQSYALAPHHVYQPTSVRKAHIQNLTDLLHVCLLKGDYPRAKRAWAILIRCREVGWRSKWNWGLALLSHASTPTPAVNGDGQPAGSQTDVRDVEKWLKSLRVTAREADKPSLLHALVLHLIKQEHYREALDELETYLTSYPYLLSGPLHTYAGMLAFYLAQSSNDELLQTQATYLDGVNMAMVRQARGWFVRAVEIDKNDEVAAEFIDQIDHPDNERSESSHRGNSEISMTPPPNRMLMEDHYGEKDNDDDDLVEVDKEEALGVWDDDDDDDESDA